MYCSALHLRSDTCDDEEVTDKRKMMNSDVRSLSRNGDVNEDVSEETKVVYEW